MKVVGYVTGTTYLVEVSESELANIAGYVTYEAGWTDFKKSNRADRSRDDILKIGSVIRVGPAWQYLTSLRSSLESSKKIGGALRTLATLIETTVATLEPPPAEETADGR